MSFQEEVYNLLVNQMSSDNQQRILSETDFNHLVSADPSSAFGNLIGIASNESVQTSLRQSSLLHLKRLVPKYWSAAFPSFVGPNCISEAVKAGIRSALLSLVADPDSKIRSSSSYTIIQISAVDYPDEWPSLLDDLYAYVNSNEFYKMLGSLTVLKDLFDDLVTEEQFFEGGVGETVISNCSNHLNNPQIPIEIKIETLKLFQISLTQLSTQLNLNASRKQLIKKIIDESSDLLIKLLNDSIHDGSSYISILQQSFKYELYKCLNLVSNNFNHIFNRKIAPNINSLNELVIKDLTALNSIKFNDSSAFPDFEAFINVQVTNFDTQKFLNELFSELFQFLSALSSKFQFQDNVPLLQTFILALTQISILPQYLKEDWSNDFNTFVTLESGLSIDFHIRNAVSDYLVDLTHDSKTVFFQVLQTFNQVFQDGSGSSTDEKESILFVLGALFQNEEEVHVDFSLVSLLNQLLDILANQNDEFLITRALLILPRFFSKFETQLDVQNFGLKALEQSLQYQYTELTKSAILFSFTYFNYFIRSKAMNSNIQRSIIKIITDLKDDSDEDTNITLLESLSVAICINNRELLQSTDVLRLILAICFKDSSNLGLIDSGRECLVDLFQDADESEFLLQCNEGLPILVNVVNEALVEKIEYSPLLDLSLEFLIIFINNCKHLTQEIFNFIFPSLTKLILSTEDDQLLQISNEVFNRLLDHSNVTELIAGSDDGLEILLQIVSKYLSPSLSDQAIANVGDLITRLIQNFANVSNVSQYLDQILQTVTRRLIISKEFPTIENLILIFANLAITSPAQTIEFLANFEINEHEKAINYVIPIWLQTFETVRGYNKIMLNIRALVQIFLLRDSRLDTIMVNSDELLPNESLNDKIITRSMRKNLQFVQIPAPLKVIKLFINELNFQLSQPDLGGAVKSAIGLVGSKKAVVTEEDDGEWEDLNEYEEFAQYGDNDEDDEEEDDDDADEESAVPRTTADNEEELSVLKAFFRQVGSDEYFRTIFSYLKDEEKRLLTDFVNSQ